MDFSYLTAGDWAEFGSQWPRAEAFLLRRSLRGELRALQGLSAPTPWQAHRLAELAAHFAEIDEREAAHVAFVTSE